MTEAAQQIDIVTRRRLTDALCHLGVVSGDILCVHVAMSRLGLVIGGARTLVEGLVDAVEPGGTLMMPAFSGDMSDPAEWEHPPVPADLLAELRNAIPAYDPQWTPTRGIGAVAEYFRGVPGARRSPHPQSSFAALGSAAEKLVERHPFDDRFGTSSPLGRLCELGGKVLLLGAPSNTVSLFHMTQHLVGGAKRVAKAAPVIERGARSWADYRDIEYPIDWFDDGVALLVERGIARQGHVGAACAILFPAAPAIEAILAWRRSTGRLPQSTH